MIAQCIEKGSISFYEISGTHLEIPLPGGLIILNRVHDKWQIRTAGHLMPLSCEADKEKVLFIYSENGDEASVVLMEDGNKNFRFIPNHDEIRCSFDADSTIRFISPLLKDTTISIYPNGTIYSENASLVSLNGKSLKETATYNDGDCLRFLNAGIFLHHDFICICKGTCITLDEKDFKVRYATKKIPFQFHSVRKFPYVFQIEDVIHAEVKKPVITSHAPTEDNVFGYTSSLTMASASLISGMFMAYRSYMAGRSWMEIVPMLVLPLTMVLSVFLLRPLSNRMMKKNRLKNLKEEEDRYIAYLYDLQKNIEQRKKQIADAMNFVYPAVDHIDQNVERGWKVRIGLIQTSLIGDVKLPDYYECSTDRIREAVSNFKNQIMTPVSVPYLLDLHQYEKITLSGECRKQMMHQLMIGLVNGSDQVKIMISPSFQELDDMLYCHQIFDEKGKRRIGCNGGMEKDCICFLPSCQEKIKNENGCIISFSDAMSGNLHIVASSDGTARIFDLNQRESIQIEMDKVENQLITPAYIPEITTRQNDFLSLYGYQDSTDLNPQEYWQEREDSRHLYARLGFDESGHVIQLDLHEGADGPHGLIAGMTGSGKSELILTMLLSLAVNYSPQDVQFVLIDFKGGGCAQSLHASRGYIPHIAGTLCNLDMNEMDRALIALKNECLRREKLFKSLHEKTGKTIRNLHEYRKWSGTSFPKLADLLIVIDEFAELKSARPDFMADLISIARVGRSLGMHLILCTQKPAGVVNEQIWANTNFKICMKVSGKQDSLEVLHDPAAAFLTKPGSFILLNGDNTIVSGQAGYAHAAASSDKVKCLSLSFEMMKKKEENPAQHQAEEISAILENAGFSLQAEKLWMDPVEKLTWDMFAGAKGCTIGLIDDIHHSDYKLLKITRENMFVISMSHTEKEKFFQTLIVSLIKATARRTISIIDDLNFSLVKKLQTNSNIYSVMTSREEKKIKQLNEYWKSHKEVLNTIIITDLSMFMENAMPLFSFADALQHPEEYHVQLIMMGTNTACLPYRYLSLVPVRWTLLNQNSQDIASLFERGGRFSVTKSEHGLMNDEWGSSFRFIRTTSEDLEVINESVTDMPLFFKGRREKGMSGI